MAVNIHTEKPTWAKKPWEEQSARTKKRWGSPSAWFHSTKAERAAKEGRGGIVTTEGTYWRTRLTNLTKKFPSRNAQKRLDWSLKSEERARLAVLGKIPQRWALEQKGKGKLNKYGDQWINEYRRDIIPQVGDREFDNTYIRGDTP